MIYGIKCHCCYLQKSFYVMRFLRILYCSYSERIGIYPRTFLPSLHPSIPQSTFPCHRDTGHSFARIVFKFGYDLRDNYLPKCIDFEACLILFSRPISDISDPLATANSRQCDIWTESKLLRSYQHFLFSFYTYSQQILSGYHLKYNYSYPECPISANSLYKQE